MTNADDLTDLDVIAHLRRLLAETRAELARVTEERDELLRRVDKAVPG